MFVPEQSPSEPEEAVVPAWPQAEERDSPILKVKMWLSLGQMLAAAVMMAVALVERSLVFGRRPLRR